jgi:hypothetical protein
MLRKGIETKLLSNVTVKGTIKQKTKGKYD